MKKLMALLLCVAMLMVGVVAQAESGYVYIKTLMKEGLSLQPDISEKLDGTNEEKLLVVLFDIQKQNVFLAGDNLWGTYEGTLWNMEPANFLALFTTFCNMYSSLESEMDAGYTLLIILQSDEDNSVTIDSAETAALVSSILTDEGTVWNTDDFSDVVAYLLAVCEEWDTIEEGLDKGYTLWVLVLIDDDNKALIDSKEDADKILEALQN